MLGWYRNWKRNRLRTQPLPVEWEGILHRQIPFYQHLDPKTRQVFQYKLKIFLGEKRFFGALDLVVTDEMKVVISALAVRLILHLDFDYYDRLKEIVVYPEHFVNPHAEEIRLGEAHAFGTVVLSWPAVLDGLKRPCDGHDTALHEFSHVLDLANGAFDGTPPLRASEHYRIWAQVMSEHFFKLREERYPDLVVLRQYGAKNEAEFFAVATEAFFEQPVVMKQLTPDLYEVLKTFYGFDPVRDPTCGQPAL